MMKGTWKRRLQILFFCAMAGVVLAAATTADARQSGKKAESIELTAATMIIEYNDTAKDIGVQFFLDLSEGWQEMEIFDPRGRQIFGAETVGILTRQGGGTELFLESVEPPIDELPFEKFFRRFPEGTYKFRGRDKDGNRITGEAEFTHDIPAGPVMISPVPGEECAEGLDADNVVIRWEPVTESNDGNLLEIVRYEVIVETDDPDDPDFLNFDVKFTSDITRLEVPPGLLKSGKEYIGEVLAIEKSGNQTITEFCFTTE